MGTHWRLWLGKTWRPLADENFHTGLGFTAGFTARDNWNYIPVPVLLPLASIGYGPATFQMTYIPERIITATSTLRGCGSSFDGLPVLSGGLLESLLKT